jgi:hypothetical protein
MSAFCLNFSEFTKIRSNFIEYDETFQDRISLEASEKVFLNLKHAQQ